MKKVYAGFLKERPRSENDYALYLGDHCIAKELQDEIEDHGNFLTVRYWISDKERSLEEIKERFVKKLLGESKTKYFDNYSEHTGYLWTDEEINVGGHDLLAELRSNMQKYCILEVEFAREGSRADQ